MKEKLSADNAAHDGTECIVKQTDEKRDDRRDEDNHERMCNGSVPRRPDDVSEFFANMLQIGDECVHRSHFGK